MKISQAPRLALLVLVISVAIAAMLAAVILYPPTGDGALARTASKTSGHGDGKGTGAGQSDKSAARRGTAFNAAHDCGQTISLTVNGKKVWDKTVGDASAELAFLPLAEGRGRWTGSSAVELAALFANYPGATELIVRGCGNRIAGYSESELKNRDRPLYLVNNQDKKLKLLLFRGRQDQQLLKVVDSVEIITQENRAGDAG